MLSLGMFSIFALVTAVRNEGFASGSPPPFLAATVISLMIFVKIFPRLASCAPFLCFIEDHLLWPDIASPYFWNFLKKVPYCMGSVKIPRSRRRKGAIGDRVPPHQSHRQYRQEENRG